MKQQLTAAAQERENFFNYIVGTPRLRSDDLIQCAMECNPGAWRAWQAAGTLKDAEIAALGKDSERFAAIANLDHVAINKWLVQAMVKDRYQSAYFAAPPGGTPEVLHASRLEALRFAIDTALAQAVQTS